MKRYIIRKYVLADNITEAIKQDKKAEVDDCWLDDKQPEVPAQADQIGFRTEGSEYFYSPVLKPKKKKRK